MKKSILAVSLMAVIGSAQSVEVGVNVTKDYSGTDRNSQGITVGQKLGSVTATLGYDQFTKGKNNQDRYSLVAAYDVAKVGPVQVSVKAGAAMLDNQTGKDGYAVTGGVGLSYPIVKNVAATVDYRYQIGQSRVSSFDGNSIGAGVKVSF